MRRGTDKEHQRKLLMDVILHSERLSSFQVACEIIMQRYEALSDDTNNRQKTTNVRRVAEVSRVLFD
jgi:hypothetical protein